MVPGVLRGSSSPWSSFIGSGLGCPGHSGLPVGSKEAGEPDADTLVLYLVIMGKSATLSFNHLSGGYPLVQATFIEHQL